MDETYDRILRGIKSSGQLQDAIIVLRWLCFSRRPLQLLEIVDVLAIISRESGGFCPDKRLPDPADIRVIYSSLISCSDIDKEACETPIQSEVNEEAGEIEIRLAHFSVKEYLISDRCFLAKDFQISICQMAIAEDCLHYLLYLFKSLPLTKDLIDQYPLSQYAAQYWWQHVQATDSTLNPTVIKFTQKMLTNKNAGLLPWIQLYNVDRPWKDIDLSLTMENVAPLLYYTASIGSPQVVEKIMPQVENVNTEGGRYGNTLQAASTHGYEKVVQMLLDTGADVNAQGGEYGNALQAVSENGNEKVVQILMDAGADVNA